MSNNFLNTIDTIVGLLNSQKRDADKLGVLARSLRWQSTLNADALAALPSLGQLAQAKKGAGCWEVERAVLAGMCDKAEMEQVPFLTQTFRRKTPGKHSNDRRRLALQALSGVAARSGNEEALSALAEGLAHPKKDTRGWTIGFLLDSYGHLGRPLHQPRIDRLPVLVDNSASSYVPFCAVMAVVLLGP